MRYKDSRAFTRLNYLLDINDTREVVRLLLTNNPFLDLRYRQFSDFQIKNLFHELDNPFPREGMPYYHEFHQLLDMYIEENKY